MNSKNFVFFCGEECIVDVDPKDPDRFERNPGVTCKTADRGKRKDGKQRKSFKEVIEEVKTCIIYRYFKKQNYQSSQVQEKRGGRYSDDYFITFVL